MIAFSDKIRTNIGTGKSFSELIVQFLHSLPLTSEMKDQSRSIFTTVKQ